MITPTKPYTRQQLLVQKIVFLLEAAEKVLGDTDIRHTGFTIGETGKRDEAFWAASPYVNPATKQFEPERLADQIARFYPIYSINAVGISLDLCESEIKVPRTKLARWRWLENASREIWGENSLCSNEYAGGSTWACIKSTRLDANAYTKISVNKIGIVTLGLGLEEPI